MWLLNRWNEHPKASAEGRLRRMSIRNRVRISITISLAQSCLYRWKSWGNRVDVGSARILHTYSGILMILSFLSLLPNLWAEDYFICAPKNSSIQSLKSVIYTSYLSQWFFCPVQSLFCILCNLSSFKYWFNLLWDFLERYTFLDINLQRNSKIFTFCVTFKHNLCNTFIEIIFSEGNEKISVK